MISDWMVNGNINDFVRARPDVNRYELVGFSFAVLLVLVLLTIENPPVGGCHQGVDLRS